jgi:hypothetical protein
MSGNFRESEMWRLSAAALAGDATDDELARLTLLLETDAEARRAYFEATSLQATLSWWQAFEPSEEEDLVRLDGPAAIRSTVPARFRRALAQQPFWGIAAAMLICGTLGFFAGRELGWRHVQRNFEEAAQLAAVPIGELSATTNCTWLGGGGVTPTINRQIVSGEEFSLLQGVATLRLAHGVELQVDGPAALVIASPSSVVLQYGTMSVRVASRAGEFEVSVPSGRFRLSSGEFGMNVGGQESEVHAFAGKVDVTLNPFGASAADAELFSIDGAPPRVETLTVQQGRGVHFASAGGALTLDREFEADRSSFATTLPMSEPLEISSEYVDAVKASRPLGYWRFSAPSDGIVRNESGPGHSLSPEGLVEYGGTPQNQYVEFGARNSHGLLLAEEPFTEFTGADRYAVECWVKPSHYHSGLVVGLIDQPRTAPHGGVVIELQPSYYEPIASSGRVRFLHRSPPSGDLGVGTSCYSQQRYALRRWQHLVAVKDGDDMRVYVNGEIAASHTDPTALAGTLHVQCGQLRVREGTRQFIGHMDELAVYDRALSPDEIQSHYRAATQSLRPSDAGLQESSPSRSTLAFSPPARWR